VARGQNAYGHRTSLGTLSCPKIEKMSRYNKSTSNTSI